MYARNEPTRDTLLGELPEATCRDWFPQNPTISSDIRAKALAREHFAISGMRRGADRQRRQADHDRAVAAVPNSGVGAQLDVVVTDPHCPDNRPLWIDAATVLPMAIQHHSREFKRAKEFAILMLEDPTAATPPHLRKQPAMEAVVDKKKRKYGALELIGQLQCEDGSRQGGRPVLVPLVVSTLGQIHGLKPIADSLATAYGRKLDRLGPRDDDTTRAQLVAKFTKDLRTSLLVAAARGHARSMIKAGVIFEGEAGG